MTSPRQNNGLLKTTAPGLKSTRRRTIGCELISDLFAEAGWLLRRDWDVRRQGYLAIRVGDKGDSEDPNMGYGT